MARCIFCGKDSNLISKSLALCVNCIRNNFDEIKEHIFNLHSSSRKSFNLPPYPPRAEDGVKCGVCVNRCNIPDGEGGFCGIRKNRDGEYKIEDGWLDWYYDPLPTNCVADWVCTGSRDYGKNNLAVFYRSCTFDCLFCQNWHFKEKMGGIRMEPEELAAKVDVQTGCICYFGGDPTSQIEHSIRTSELALERRNVRICWETNGSMNRTFLKKMIELSLKSGGCIKFDLKVWNEKLNIGLCGVSNKQTLENFEYAASFIPKRRESPLIVASTLLVPGYTDLNEIKNIAKFIASLNRDIPYSLLGFYPHFHMNDLPRTSRDHAYRAEKAAQDEGLNRVRIGNPHLLSSAYTVEEKEAQK